MLAFRKLFLALALVTLTAVGANAALSTPALQCIANAGVPPIVRAEGLAELVGDLVLNCTGGYPAGFIHGVQEGATGTGPVLGPASIPQVNVQVFLNTNITSKLIGDPGSEALLLIDDPLPGDQKLCLITNAACVPANRPNDPGNVYKAVNGGAYNIWQGRQVGANSVVWLGVPIDAPGTNNIRTIRVTNVRANANQLGVSSTLVPTQIVMFVSITGSTSVPVNNPQQTVAWIQTGLGFSVRRYNDEGSTSTRSLTQCSHHNGDLYLDSTNTGACPSSRLRFEELFATAWKTRYNNMPAFLTGSAAEEQNTPGKIFNRSESGLWSTASSWTATMASAAGVASQGTRLRIVVNNVPAGVRVFVTTKNVGAQAPRGDANEARLVAVASDGSGNYVEIQRTTRTSKSCDLVTDTTNGDDIAEVPIFGGSGIAVWEVIATDPLAIQKMDFGLVLAWRANPASNIPGLGTITVNGMFAPISTVTSASSLAPVPRFADTSSAKNSVSINQCVTNLLFPYVTNQGGFNTGMVISNTSKDPYGTGNEAGACTLWYYGDTNGGAAPPSQTSGVVPSGDYLAFDLLSGGKFGVTPTPNFQGYVIAQCKFRWAHGYAFISDTGLARVANGYLALILDSGLSRGGTGESLGQ